MWLVIGCVYRLMRFPECLEPDYHKDILSAQGECPVIS